MSCVLSAAVLTAAKMAADDAELFSESVFGDDSGIDVFGKISDEFFDIVVEDDAVSPFAGKVLGYGGWNY